ncbi:MAG: hypothetical protein GY743_22085 [Planctomycetaceae bacterium]|nr:hypothetical protein [Planctomycetaceae bacterium]
MARLIFFLIQDGWCVPAIRLARFPGLGVASLDGLQFPPRPPHPLERWLILPVIEFVPCVCQYCN